MSSLQHLSEQYHSILGQGEMSSGCLEILCQMHLGEIYLTTLCVVY